MDGLSSKEKQGLLENGAIFVFLDVPPGTEFGIDYCSWDVGPNFKGVKMIPPGIHFIYYSAQSSDGQRAPRTGFFHEFRLQEVLIKKWNKQDEDVCNSPVTAEEKQALLENKRDMDRFLGPYPYDYHEKWVSLTRYIKPSLLKRLNPTCGKIYSSPQFVPSVSTSQSRKEAAEQQMESGDAKEELQDADGLPSMLQIPETMINFTEFPKKMYPENSTPQEISRHSMDRSWFMEKLIDGCVNISELSEDFWIGELQYAFVVFLIAQQFEGFEQWKKIVSLFCNSESAVHRYPSLFMNFIEIMYHHIQEIPEDYFVDITDAKDNFLVVNLRNFFMNCDTSGNQKICARARKFQKHLEKRYGWEFPGEEIDEEDMPAVVDWEDYKKHAKKEGKGDESVKE